MNCAVRQAPLTAETGNSDQGGWTAWLRCQSDSTGRRRGRGWDCGARDHNNSTGWQKLAHGQRESRSHQRYAQRAHQTVGGMVRYRRRVTRSASVANRRAGVCRQIEHRLRHDRAEAELRRQRQQEKEQTGSGNAAPGHHSWPTYTTMLSRKVQGSGHTLRSLTKCPVESCE